MEDVILLSQLNDFIFCPVSIYFHNLYGDMDKILYQNTSQIAGTKAHERVDKKKYSTSKHILMSLDVFCEKYRISGKIDMFDVRTGCLTERKKKIINIYDGYVFQLFGQYFALQEMGYIVKKLQLYSMDDNKIHSILLPEDNPVMLSKYLERFGHRIQYSVFELDNSKKVLDNIMLDIKNNFKRKFSQCDSVYIFELSGSCKITRYGYAKNEETDLHIIT